MPDRHRAMGQSRVPVDPCLIPPPQTLDGAGVSPGAQTRATALGRGSQTYSATPCGKAAPKGATTPLSPRLGDHEHV